MLVSLMAIGLFAAIAQTASDSTQSLQYNMLMQVRGREITGLCMMEKAADGSIVGTVVSEMGMKTFDFIYNNGKAKLLNVFKPIDKWYIKRVLNNDFTLLLANLNTKQEIKKKRRVITPQPTGEIVMRNTRYNICYTLIPTLLE